MSDFDAFFSKLRWRKLDPPTSLPVYVNDYAAFGFAKAETAGEIADGWSRWQAALFQLRKRPEVGDEKDLYLVSVLAGDEDPEHLIPLQSIIDDTHVCRKIVLPQRGRSVTETLMESPLFQVVGTGEIDDGAAIQIEKLPLDMHVVEDLAKRSASTIFERLLAGKYRRTDED